MKAPKHYFGNYPNSYDYDPNIPIGWNRWDAEDNYEERDEENELQETDDEFDNENDI